jgi:hypothetical protein
MDHGLSDLFVPVQYCKTYSTFTGNLKVTMQYIKGVRFLTEYRVELCGIKDKLCSSRQSADTTETTGCYPI